MKHDYIDRSPTVMAILLIVCLSYIAACASCMQSQRTAKPSYESGDSRMDKDRFLDYLNENNLAGTPIVVTAGGEENEGCFSGNKYVHFECVIFTGEGEITSAYYSPWVTEEIFLLSHGKEIAELTYRSVRLFLEPGYDKLYDETNFSGAPERVKEIVPAEAKRVLVAEYGLKKGVEYHCLLHKDYYMINGPDGPEEKSNAVLWISDLPFKDGNPQRNLTPEYRGWTY